jgi:hypothetical protein
VLRSLSFTSVAIIVALGCTDEQGSSAKRISVNEICAGKLQDLGSLVMYTDYGLRGASSTIQINKSDLGSLKDLPVARSYSSYRSYIKEGYSVCIYEKVSDKRIGYHIGSGQGEGWDFAEWFNDKADQYFVIKGQSCPENPQDLMVEHVDFSPCSPREMQGTTSFGRAIGEKESKTEDRNFKVDKMGQVQVRERKYRWQDVHSGAIYSLCSRDQPKIKCDEYGRAWGWENDDSCRHELRDSEC